MRSTRQPEVPGSVTRPTIHYTSRNFFMRKVQEYRKYWTPYLFLLPSLFLIIWLKIIPAIFAVRLSLYKTVFVSTVEYVGLRQYELALESNDFADSLWLTIKYGAISLILSLSLGLMMALIVRRGTIANMILRVIFIIPWVMPKLISAMLWKWVLDTNSGIVNLVTEWLGLSYVSIFVDPKLAFTALILITVWAQAPYAMIAYLAGLQGIPDELYEAASLDGANKAQQLAYITIPLLRPAIAVVSIFLGLHYFTDVVIVLVLTGGGPAKATNILPLYLYNAAFAHNNFGAAGALAVLTILITLPLTILYVNRRTVAWS